MPWLLSTWFWRSLILFAYDFVLKLTKTMIPRTQTKLAKQKSFDLKKLDKIISNSRQLVHIDFKNFKIIDNITHGNPNDAQTDHHIHDLLLIDYLGRKYLVKEEDVFNRISNSYSPNYRSFFQFANSIFYNEDSFTPTVSFSFFDDPEVAPITFKWSDIMPRIGIIKSINDQTKPLEIDDDIVRSLFQVYRIQKEDLIEMDGVIYENLFNQHGRDIVNELLASGFGYLLGIPVPKATPAVRQIRYRKPFGNPVEERDLYGEERAIMLEYLGDKYPPATLYGFLYENFSLNNADLRMALEILYHNGNPLNLEYFESVYYNHNKPNNPIGSLVIKLLRNHCDLIKSDFLDHLLFGYDDRKIHEFICPNGLDGRVYTVDFGDILFPELSLPVDEPHYLHLKTHYLHSFSAYLDRVLSLPNDNEYKESVLEICVILQQIDRDFFPYWIGEIPESLFKYHWDDERLGYDRSTLSNFLLALIDELHHKIR